MYDITIKTGKMSRIMSLSSNDGVKYKWNGLSAVHLYASIGDIFWNKVIPSMVANNWMDELDKYCCCWGPASSGPFY